MSTVAIKIRRGRRTKWAERKTNNGNGSYCQVICAPSIPVTESKDGAWRPGLRSSFWLHTAVQRKSKEKFNFQTSTIASPRGEHVKGGRIEQAANGRPMIRAGQGGRVGISDLGSLLQVESRRKGRVERAHTGGGERKHRTSNLQFK
jgi:hypothetical protein